MRHSFKGRLLAIPLVVVGCVCIASESRANELLFSPNVGAMLPISKYLLSVKKNVGGTTGFLVGYRFDLGDHFAIDLVAQPQFTIWNTQQPVGDDVSSMFIFTGGPRFVARDGRFEAHLDFQGGHYRDMSGPLNFKGPGFNAGGGLDFFITDRDVIGLWGRYDYAYIKPDLTSDLNERQFALTGLSYTRLFVAEAPLPPATAVPSPPPPPPPPPTAKRKLVLRGVNFDFDKSNIRADARPVLDEAVRVLKDDRQVDVSVEGHTDSIGTERYNQRLSERRARSVTDYLVRGGIARNRLSPKGYGESRPVASNDTADGRAQNRRVELRVLGE